MAIVILLLCAISVAYGHASLSKKIDADLRVSGDIIGLNLTYAFNATYGGRAYPVEMFIDNEDKICLFTIEPTTENESIVFYRFDPGRIPTPMATITYGLTVRLYGAGMIAGDEIYLAGAIVGKGGWNLTVWAVSKFGTIDEKYEFPMSDLLLLDGGMFISNDYDYIYIAITVMDPSSPQTDTDIMVIKYSIPRHEIVWERIWDSGCNETVGSVVAFGSDIYIGGNIENGSSGKDILILKYNDDGDYVSNMTLELSDFDEEILDMYVDNSGTIYMVGYVDVVNEEATNKDLLIMKLNTTSMEIRSATWGGNETEVGYSVTIWYEYLYVAGCMESSDGCYRDVLFAIWGREKLNLINYYVWDSGYDETGYFVDTDSTGNIYLTGSISLEEGEGILVLGYLLGSPSNQAEEKYPIMRKEAFLSSIIKTIVGIVAIPLVSMISGWFIIRYRRR